MSETAPITAREALALLSDPASWRAGAICDPNSPRFEGQKLAADALAALSVQPARPRTHVYWGAGELDCPHGIKAPNGELHTLRCKVCGQDNPREEVCAPSAATTSHEALCDDGGPRCDDGICDKHCALNSVREGRNRARKATALSAAPAPVDRTNGCMCAPAGDGTDAICPDPKTGRPLCAAPAPSPEEG